MNYKLIHMKGICCFCFYKHHVKIWFIMSIVAV